MKSSRQYIDPNAPLRMEIQASAQVLITNDTMTVKFKKQATGSKLDKLNNEVIGSINEAVDIASSYPSVRVQTGSIDTSEDWRKDDGDEDEFVVTGNLKLVSSDLTAISRLAGILAQTMTLDGVEFGLSQNRRNQERSTLIQELANEFRSRADLLTESFGYEQFTMKTLNIVADDDRIGHVPRDLPVACASMSPSVFGKKDYPTLSVEPGNTMVRVSAAGVIELR